MTPPGLLSLRGRLGFLARDTAVYGLGEALIRALALITFPLLARHFSVADFGTIDFLTTCILLLVVLLVFGQDSATARYFYETDDRATRRQVVSQSLAFEIGVMALVLPAGWILAPAIADFLGLPEANGTLLVRLAILQAPFFVFVNLSLSLLKWTFKRWQFLSMAVGTTLATLVGLLTALFFFELDMVGVFTVYLVVRAIFALLGLWLVREWLTIPTGSQQLRQLLPFAISFGFISGITALTPVLERGLVGNMVGDEALGLYAAGAKVAMLISLVINAIETAWGPFSLVLHREEDAAQTYNHVLKGVCLLLFCAVLTLTAFSDPIVSILGSARYSGAGAATFALCLGLAANAIGSIASVGIVLSKRAHLKLYAYGALLLIAVIAIPAGAWLFGLAGAAWGSALAMMAKTLVETLLARRAYPLAWDYRAPLLLGGLTIAVGVAHQLTFGLLEIRGVSLLPLGGLVLLPAVSWFLLLDAGERRQFSGLLRSLADRKGPATHAD
jgi:O-antigen/teichoic acid export membrane protein